MKHNLLGVAYIFWEGRGWGEWDGEGVCCLSVVFSNGHTKIQDEGRGGGKGGGEKMALLVVEVHTQKGEGQFGYEEGGGWKEPPPPTCRSHSKLSFRNYAHG